jgi:hypothetical protein
MRRPIAAFLSIIFLAATLSASAATGRVVKVLPQYLDLKGRHTLSPSLYDRDAYQAMLRQHPELRSALRFEVLWRGKADGGATLKLRAELRGTAKGNLPSRTTLATDVKVRTVSAGHWTSLTLGGEDYAKFGEVTAWRVTLWDGDQLVAEQKSFLW